MRRNRSYGVVEWWMPGKKQSTVKKPTVQEERLEKKLWFLRERDEARPLICGIR